MTRKKDYTLLGIIAGGLIGALAYPPNQPLGAIIGAFIGGIIATYFK